MWRGLGVWLSLGGVECGAGWECGYHWEELSMVLFGSVAVTGRS